MRRNNSMQRMPSICHIDDAMHTLRFLQCHAATTATIGNLSPLAAVGRGI